MSAELTPAQRRLQAWAAAFRHHSMSAHPIGVLDEPITGSDWRTIAEVAEATRVTIVTVRRWIADGELTSYLVFGRRLVRRADLNRFVLDRTLKAAP